MLKFDLICKILHYYDLKYIFPCNCMQTCSILFKFTKKKMFKNIKILPKKGNGNS